MNRFFIVGTGPGDLRYLTPLALDAINLADWIVGYKLYLDLIKDIITNKQIYTTGMGSEIDRVKFAIEKYKDGLNVALISGGDSSLYGLASLCFELGDDVDFDVIPGISAAFAASAKLGAPITDDLVLLSLSDQLTPRETILKRIDAIILGDFVSAIYNPKSRKRTELLPYTIERFLQTRGDLPVGIVKNCTRQEEDIEVTYLSKIDYNKIDMFTILLVGNSKTYIKNHKMITPRGYLNKYAQE
ncbi:MAG: precorrin-3B C(17)-methyltransferase [Calditerrivibrio sp.]|nr:precorrin-3B C(17)-methyltransferase [Calditerrivibrio sp.]